jgi:recombination protein RecA
MKDPAGTVIGNRTRVKIVKNKVAPPFTEAEFDILYSCGISREGSILDAALQRGICEKRGSWIAYGEKQLGQGTVSAIDFLKSNPETTEEIAEKTRTAPLIPSISRKK